MNYRFCITALALFAFLPPAIAHEIWIEKTSGGPARIYFGEPADPDPDHDSDAIERLKSPKVFAKDREKAVSVVRKGDHLEADVADEGDIRLFDDKVFEPWEGRDGDYQAQVYHARAGREETSAHLDFELVPVEPDSDRFIVQFRGEPVPGARVAVVNPELWEKSFKADESGRIAVPVTLAGRYILVASHQEEVKREIQGKAVTQLNHITTLTFHAEESSPGEK